MNKKDTLILAIDSEAQKITDNYYEKNPEINYLCLLYEMTIINTNKKKTIWYNNLKFQKTEYDFDAYREILRTRTSKFQEIIQKYKNILVVSCIKNDFSANTLFEVIKYFIKSEIPHKVFVVKPADFDGKTACEIGKEALNSLDNLKYSIGNNLFLYNSIEVIKHNPDSIGKAISLANEKASEILSMILDTKNI